MAAIELLSGLVAPETAQPSEIYHGSHNDPSAPILLRIGNGGAGQSGLIEALSNAFIDHLTSTGHPPFRIAWYLSDTTATIAGLGSGTLDLGITYLPCAARVAIVSGIVHYPAHYLFRDHFVLIGPSSNPAGLEKGMGIQAALHRILSRAATQPFHLEPEIRFLSRFDRSATTVREQSLWLAIGQVPWASPPATWYIPSPEFPQQALCRAVRDGCYHLTDRGTLLSLREEVGNEAVVYCEGEEMLLSPAHLLLGTRAVEEELAREFVAWCVGEMGQDIVRGFCGRYGGGRPLYLPAP